MKKTIVLKVGGRLIDENIGSLDGVKTLLEAGNQVVIVHGGGLQISKALEANNVKSAFYEGYRITSKEAMGIVENTLSLKLNNSLVNRLTSSGIKSIGLSGKDDDLLICKKKYHKSVDLGYVGQIETCNITPLKGLLENDYTPVISTIGKDNQGISYNINADDVASEIACHLGADHLFFLSDVDGYYEDINNPESIYKTLSLAELSSLIKGNQITGGMIPKLNNIKKTLEHNVNKVTIMNGCELDHIGHVITSNSKGTSFYKGE